MKKLIFTLTLSFALIGCEAPQSASADPDGRSLIDPTEMIEVKQGPYMGDEDKTRFEPVEEKKIILKE